MGRYGGGGGKHKGMISRGSNQRGALVRNRYGQYRVESGVGKSQGFAIKGQRHAVKSKLRPSTSGAPYQTNTMRRAQSAGRTRSNQPVYWGATKSNGKQTHAYYPGGASKSRRPQSAGAIRKTSGPVMATKQFYGANALQKKVSAGTNATKGREKLAKNNSSNASMEKTVSTTLSVGSQNTRSNPNAPIMKPSISASSNTINNPTCDSGKTNGKQQVENIDPKGFEEMRDANRKLAERNAKLRDELQQLREQLRQKWCKAIQNQRRWRQRVLAEREKAKTDNREVYQPGRHANTITKHISGKNGNAERVEYKSSSSAGTNSSWKSGRPQSAGPSSRGKLHAQGSPRNAVNVQREVAARATYSRQQRPQSAGGARSNSSSAAKTSSRPENRPGSAARRREQASASGRTKLVRPGTAPARRPDNAAAIKKMVSDAAHHNQPTMSRLGSAVS